MTTITYYYKGELITLLENIKDQNHRVVDLFYDIDLKIKAGDIIIKYEKYIVNNKLIFNVVCDIISNEGKLIYTYLRTDNTAIETKTLYGAGLFNNNSVVQRIILLDSKNYSNEFLRVVKIIV